MLARARNLVVAGIAPIADEHQFSLRIDRNATDIGQTGVRSFDDPQGFFSSGGVLAEYQHARRILIRRVKLLLLFIDG